MPQGATGFEHTYPNIARWVQSYGWIEIGDDGQSPSFVRALDEGGEYPLKVGHPVVSTA